MVSGDFEGLFPIDGSAPRDDSVLRKRKATDQGPRENLRVYETMPPQMLNAYGMASYAQMPHVKVWEELNKPLKSGAKYMTELCSREDERRGVGINRWLQVFVEYLKYQSSAPIKAQNEFILKPDLCNTLYGEITWLLEFAQYILAAKKQYAKKGAGCLRTAVSIDSNPSPVKDTDQIKKHAGKLYAWLKSPQSRTRMLIQWQSAGGLPYVCGTHLLATNIFVNFGNKLHDVSQNSITQEEFENAILKRHEMELKGHPYLGTDENSGDFAAA